MHLVHSPDDDGWYWERTDDWVCSIIYPTERDARDAELLCSIKWDVTTLPM